MLNTHQLVESPHGRTHPPTRHRQRLQRRAESSGITPVLGLYTVQDPSTSILRPSWNENSFSPWPPRQRLPASQTNSPLAYRPCFSHLLDANIRTFALHLLYLQSLSMTNRFHRDFFCHPTEFPDPFMSALCLLQYL